MKDELLYPKQALENAYKNGKLDLLTQLITEVEGMKICDHTSMVSDEEYGHDKAIEKVITLLKNKRDNT